jgi:hypothetical protein
MIPPTGISASLKDKRVDRVLEKLGYEAAACKIFYSPVMVWVYYLALLLATLIPLTSFYLVVLMYRFPVYWVPYLLSGYLAAAYLNNSFVLAPDKLLVINPNPPFRRVVPFELENVRKVTIDRPKWLWLSTLFIFLGRNYVEISTDGKTERFYCASLELDAFDENLTEKTIDDFHFALEARNVPTAFNLD